MESLFGHIRNHQNENLQRAAKVKMAFLKKDPFFLRGLSFKDLFLFHPFAHQRTVVVVVDSGNVDAADVDCGNEDVAAVVV